ncbi:MAG: fumarylacetoacetate hydrolase family protein, partial [Candidatus Nitrosocosmicus sp.]
MKIARLRSKDSIETYGIVSNDGKKLITKEQIQERTGIPIPPNIKEFLFGGWLDEINIRKKELEFDILVDDVELLSP